MSASSSPSASLLEFLRRSYPTTISSTISEVDIPDLSLIIYPNISFTDNEKVETTQWLTTSLRLATPDEDEAKHAERLGSLNTHLSTRTTLLGTKPCVADVALYYNLAPAIKAWSAEERTGEQGYHHIVRFVDFVQNAPLYGLSLDAGNKIDIDVNDVKFVHKPLDAKAEKERVRKEKAAAAAIGDGRTQSVAGNAKSREAAQDMNDKAKAGVAGDSASQIKKEKKEKQPKPPKQPTKEIPLSPCLIDLRVGRVLKAINHPNADSLFVSTIACGDPAGTENTSEYEGQIVRTVCSGLNGLIPLSEMQGRKIVAVCNLKPVTMRGVKSAAMVLAASPRLAAGEEDNHKGPVELVDPPADASTGERLYFDGWQGGSEGVLNPKKKVWETLQPGFTTTEALEVGFDVGAVDMLKAEREADGKMGVGRLRTSGALSGHPSPLLSSSIGTINVGGLQDLLSPAETALLSSLAYELGKRHQDIRKKATLISSKHPSTVCRAVATEVTSTHLAKFQQRILEVEKDILEESPTIVGAYNIVPLSGLVGAFDGWSRKLEWLWDLVHFIQHSDEPRYDKEGEGPCTASRVIERLRDSTHTGYPDVELISLNLVRVAETAWLRQISAWVLYGRFPTFGSGDFFIVREEKSERAGGLACDYSMNDTLVPKFLTRSTANSIIFIGRSLNHIRDRSSVATHGSSRVISPELALLPDHLAHLSSLGSPITSSGLSTAIGAIRVSLSKNALQKLLPMSKVLEILRVLRDFFLLERGEFALALISAADERLSSRHHRFIENMGKKGFEDLGNVVIKEGEVSAVLARTWAAMASLQAFDNDEVDQELDLARELVKMSIISEDSGSSAPAAARPGQAKLEQSTATFNDLLLLAPTKLTIRVPSPLDLFLTPLDVEIYSNVNAYLISIRRAHLHLSRLSLLSVLRRNHPSPKAPSHTSHQDRFEALARMRHRADQRAKRMRALWATIGHAAFLLAEIGEYFQGEVIKGLWEEFHAWLDPPPCSLKDPTDPLSSPSIDKENQEVTKASPPIHDPESLSLAHAAFLTSLSLSLLLDSPPFKTNLRTLLAMVDHLSALLHRLSTVQQNLDLETDVGVVDTFTNYAREEKDLLENLGVARGGLKGAVAKVIDALREIDSMRAGGPKQGGLVKDGEFVPKRGGGVDHLLLKLDYAKVGY